MKYLGIDFEDVHYVQGGREWWQQQLCCWQPCVSMFINLLFVAPDFDRSSWLNVKETLGMQFPNVSVCVVCV